MSYISKEEAIASINKLVETTRFSSLPEVIEAISSLPDSEEFADLQHFKDSSIGLWCTDKPELIPEEIKHLFFQIK